MFLVSIGRPNEAKEVLNKVAKVNGVPPFTGELTAGKLKKRGSLKALFATHTYARLTICLGFTWFACGLLYYGIILLSVQIQVTPHRCLQNFYEMSHPIGNQKECCAPLSVADYVALSVSTLGEFFGILLQFLLIDWIGRRRFIMIGMLLTSVLLITFQFCMPTAALSVLLFIARGFIYAVFNVNYVYTNEAYPTSIRTFGLGVCSSMSKVGAMLTPFVAQVMLAEVSMIGALLMYCLVGLAGTIAAFFLPFDTENRSLKQSVEDDENTKAATGEEKPLKEIKRDYEAVRKDN